MWSSRAPKIFGFLSCLFILVISINQIYSMVLISDGNSVHVPHVSWGNQLMLESYFWFEAVINMSTPALNRSYYHCSPPCAPFSNLPSDISTMIYSWGGNNIARLLRHERKGITRKTLRKGGKKGEIRGKEKIIKEYGPIGIVKEQYTRWDHKDETQKKGDE